MKYFEIVKNPKIKRAPTIINWYGHFDVRNIKLDTFAKLPERELLIVEMTEKEIFTDFIMFPFLLISHEVKQVIEMYGDICFCRQIILLNQSNGTSEIYYLPVLDESDTMQFYYKEFEDGTCLNGKQEQKQVFNVDKNIFWISDSLTRHTIISMDMAESLLRRGMTGLELKEIVLYKEK